MKYLRMKRGTFLERPNRFIAYVEIDGNKETEKDHNHYNLSDNKAYIYVKATEEGINEFLKMDYDNVDFIFRKIPSDWSLWDIERRRSFWRGAAYTDENEITGLVERDRISAAEIWCELLNGEMNCMTITETKTLNNIIASTNAWEVPSVPMRFGPYGVQRGFIRKA